MDKRPDRWQLKETLERKVARMERAERERSSLLAQTGILGMLGLVFVIPVVAGALLGRWMDTLFGKASSGWTLGMILLGVVVGAVNMFLYLRR
ncbi:MAG: AtpZ/AtpI family protein [Candidatus Lambdaproteobacteria bacterium]|nr:AtpZ/AtpI family protein [Candidatus Lambdaproteobacteria bacterium]